MTVQTKHYIELSDITTLRFDCKECGATLSLPLSQHTRLALDNCPSCGVRWTTAPGINYAPAITAFRGSLQALQGVMSIEQTPMPFSMVLEVQPDVSARTLFKTA